MRIRREVLEEEIEVEELEQRLDTLQRRRFVGRTPIGPVIANELTLLLAVLRVPSTVPSEGAAYASSRMPSRIRLRELDLFKGKTLKEARDFLYTLELVIALARQTYASDYEKVLYSVIYLAGEPRNNWHHSYRVEHLKGYT